jgi:CRP/FNR family transcriptional regulator, cyclic AMP receptor protein
MRARTRKREVPVGSMIRIVPVRRLAKALKSPPEFDLQAFLDSAGLARTVLKYSKAGVVYAQGDPAAQVMYIQQGSVKISVLSKTGKEAIVGMLSAGDFFGEGCLAGQSRRMATATAMTPTTVLIVEKPHMMQMLHKEPALSDLFRVHMLARNIRIEEDLVDQLFNSSEKRLARTLLLMARYGQEDKPQQVVHQLSQETLAEMVGTTRSRVNFFMNKFRDLGFIEYNGGLKVNSSLLSVVLHD